MGLLKAYIRTPDTPCLVKVSGIRAFDKLLPLLKDCHHVFLGKRHHLGDDDARLLLIVWRRGTLMAFVHFWVETSSVYLGASIARRIQRAWRRYVARGRCVALCMASHSRLGADASPLLDTMLSVLCVEDLRRMIV